MPQMCCSLYLQAAGHLRQVCRDAVPLTSRWQLTGDQRQGQRRSSVVFGGKNSLPRYVDCSLAICSRKVPRSIVQS